MVSLSITPKAFRTFSHVLLLLLLLVAAAGCKKTTKPFQGAALANLKGQLRITRPGQESYLLTPAMLGTPKGLVAKGDQLATQKDSSIDIQFPNGVSMRLGPKTSLTITQSMIGAQGEASQIRADLKQGRLMTKTQKLSADSTLTVKTPTLVASVRGTEFLVKPDKKEVLVQTGSVEIQPPGSETTKIVEGGNKAEATETDVEINPLTEEDKQELSAMQEGLEFINAETRARMDEIRSSFEEERDRIRGQFQEQVDRNKETMEAEKERQKEEFETQKDRITGAKDKIKQDEAKNALDRIKNP